MPSARPPALAEHWLIACEQAGGRVMALDPRLAWDADAAVRWSWTPAADPGIARRDLRAFDYLSEARPGADGSGLLVTASGGAVAAVGLEDAQVAWYAVVGGNPHAVTALPGGWIVAASSTGGYLSLFVQPRRRRRLAVGHVRRVPLDDAHAVAWDEARGVLWALGGSALHAFHWRAEEAGLVLEQRIPLPGAEGGRAPGGHDLLPLLGSPGMLVSDERRVWRFDRDALAFAPFEPLAATADVKSLSCLPDGRALVAVIATQVWWSDTVRAVGTGFGDRTMPGARFYKARWLAGTLPLLYRAAPSYGGW